MSLLLVLHLVSGYSEYWAPYRCHLTEFLINVWQFPDGFRFNWPIKMQELWEAEMSSSTFAFWQSPPPTVLAIWFASLNGSHQKVFKKCQKLCWVAIICRATQQVSYHAQIQQQWKQIIYLNSHHITAPFSTVKLSMSDEMPYLENFNIFIFLLHHIACNLIQKNNWKHLKWHRNRELSFREIPYQIYVDIVTRNVKC